MDRRRHAAHTYWHRQTMHQQGMLVCTDMQLISRAQQLAQTCHPPAEHKAVHTARQPISRAKAVHTGGPLTSRAQSCAYQQAADQQST